MLMKRALWLMCALLIVVSMTVPAVASGSSAWVQGTSSNKVHLRQKPDMASESLGLYFTGTKVTVIQELANGWTQVLIGTEAGYIRSDLLSKIPVDVDAPVYEVSKGNNGYVNLRSAPNSSASVLARISNGTKAYVLGETTEGWYYIDTGDEIGFMMKKFLTSSNSEKTQSVVPVVGYAYDGTPIFAYTTDKGQTIYFVSHDRNPAIEFVDVNFDGQYDLVIRVSTGSTNRFDEFYVWDGEEYTRVSHVGIEYGIGNYTLYPELGMVMSLSKQGYAGALYEKCLFCWDGTELKLVRRAVSETLSVSEYNGQVLTSVTYQDVLRLTVWDYTSGEEKIVYQGQSSVNEFDFTFADEALWTGLR